MIDHPSPQPVIEAAIFGATDNNAHGACTRGEFGKICLLDAANQAQPISGETIDISSLELYIAR